MDVFKPIFVFILIQLSISLAGAHVPKDARTSPVLADLHLLQRIGAPILSADKQLNVGYAYLTAEGQNQLSQLAHQYGKCGGFEVIQDLPMTDVRQADYIFNSLKQKRIKDFQFSRAPVRFAPIPQRVEIAEAIKLADEKNLMNWVNWLSAFENRYNRAANPNVHVVQMKAQLEKMLQFYRARNARPVQIDLINHTSTKQQSIRVRLLGSTKPSEVVVLGGHLDSINQMGGSRAPGSDDNASGSSNVVEALRVLMTQPQTARTLDFFWYAGEESGLLGSAEIAKEYKKNNINVVAVLQLDMTLFPGKGEFVIASMTDFTSSWLRDVFVQLNQNYLGAKIVEDQCGYGCSDHASWYRQGYPTLMPFEATMNTMNRNIHTTKDIVTPEMSFKHSLVFTKLAIALAMELGNNLNQRQPY